MNQESVISERNKHSYLILYGPTWDGASQVSKHHLAKYWANLGHSVLYVESQFHLFSFITRMKEALRLLTRFIFGPNKVENNLWIHCFPSVFPYRSGVSFLANSLTLAINQFIPRRLINSLCESLKLDSPVVIVGTATALPIIERLNPKLVVYHCSDDYSSQPNFPSSFKDLEKKLIARADLIICTAEELTEIKAPMNPQTYTITNGADIDHFKSSLEDATEVPAEIKDFSGPVIGYVGTIFEWLDFEMIANAAREKPGYNFVFIGPITTDISLIHDIPNIHMLGPKSYGSIPNYLKGFDVATIPFIIHDVTLRASPVKFYEYLASGTPIVATRLPDLDRFDHLVTLFSRPDQYVESLDKALANKSKTALNNRIEEASNHSWESRFEKIDELIDQLVVKLESNK
ncbi:MAG: Glycosyltransferase involved in cell wall bisynthesis [Chloroflexi bacterium]|nr:MAG: Glycosyltransferase involved in cell wall bisynthesis [Chloroflexota bacterium]